jgi:hypothetical protein
MPFRSYSPPWGGGGVKSNIYTPAVKWSKNRVVDPDYLQSGSRSSILAQFRIRIHKVIESRLNMKEIRTFWLDPNPKKKFGLGYGFGSRHCCKITFLWKIADQTLEREKNIRFSVGNHFSLSYRFQNTYDSNERHHFKKIRVKILVQGSESETKSEKMCGSESKKNEFGSTTLSTTELAKTIFFKILNKNVKLNTVY